MLLNQTKKLFIEDAKVRKNLNLIMWSKFKDMEKYSNVRTDKSPNCRKGYAQDESQK